MSTSTPNSPSPEPTDTASTADPSTHTLETNAMSDNEIRRSNESPEFSDPTADPDISTASGLSNHLGWPEVQPSGSSQAASTTSAGATTPIPTTATRAVPASTPFRVEPAHPVPDDVVPGPAAEATSSGLPHLPPPVVAPVPDTGAHQPPPRPALVVVRRGPRPGTIMLGLLSMLVAAYVLLANFTDTDLSLRLVGPPMIGAFGAMLLIVGLIGVVVGRFRR